MFLNKISVKGRDYPFPHDVIAFFKCIEGEQHS